MNNCGKSVLTKKYNMVLNGTKIIYVEKITTKREK